MFTAHWAGGVAILRGFLDQILKEIPNVSVNWVDAEDNKELSLSFGIDQIPSIIMLRDHEIVDHINGIIARRKLAERMRRHL